MNLKGVTDDPKAWEPPSRLFAGWCEFAKECNAKPGRQAEFTDKLVARGFRRDRRPDQRRWMGVKLKHAPGLSSA